MKLINLPETPGEYKLSQLLIHEQPTTIFGATNEFHQEHIREALKQQNITYPYLLPTYQGENYQILGGGKIYLNPPNKELSKPYSHMIGYNRQPHEQLTNQLLKTLNWKLTT